MRNLNRLALPPAVHYFFTMKQSFPSRAPALGLALLTMSIATGSLVAAEKKADEAARRDAENLQRYDRNANGKLDPDEVATMKADEARKKPREPSKEEEKEKAPKKG